MSSVAPKSNNELGMSLMLLALALGFTWLLLGSFRLGDVSKLFSFITLATCILFKQRWVIYLVAVAFIFVGTQRWQVGLNFDVSHMMRVFAFMGYLVFSLRFTDCPLRLRFDAGVKGALTVDTSQKHQIMQATRPIMAGLLWIPLALFAAYFLLWGVPLDATTDERLGIQPTGFRSITVFWLLSVFWFVGSGLFWWMAERENDPLRARVFLRSVFGQQVYPELNPIEKSLAKKRMRKSD